MVESLKLKTRWTVWENFFTVQGGQQSDEAWKRAINKVLSFDDLGVFAKMWNNLSYHKPTQTFFFDPVKKVNRRFEVKDRTEMEQINGINIFRNDITPEWADPENKNGGDYQLMLDESNNPENIDEYWQELLLQVVGETFKLSDQINGIRLIDKSRGDLAIRLEIWVKYDKDNDTKLALEFEGALADFLKANESKVKVHFSKIQYKSHK
mmetsp:Transcript_71973/g.83631  ORF Transcript_71973/g.83631 Transcript_71973/m.83631 type:complete len:209 (+) Transcript_71973:45-671(+)|eukprot:CAMPEP_0176411908 /NCGR_PEP_ID=MMETSP0127-20121128/3856_1 /TAXON_ID=938130 /ORGANISM="Platyophrya macrostoma, Strain WH" /LENGTH=208 /DNA_ID=CAMNT_0017791533 /DNA_START=44 /DNA_END=670 /DNA_ORIENTATION=+